MAPLGRADLYTAVHHDGREHLEASSCLLICLWLVFHSGLGRSLQVHPAGVKISPLCSSLRLGGLKHRVCGGKFTGLTTSTTFYQEASVEFIMKNNH